MRRTVSQVASVSRSDPQQVKRWAREFREYLTTSANPRAGECRSFEDDDTLAMIFIACQSAGGANDEEIKFWLDSRDHHADQYRKELYLHTPLFQEVPDGIDETWTHGSLYLGSFFSPFELARDYRACAEELLDLTLKQDVPLELRSPFLFAYRHALELYLKVLGRVEELTHSLRHCLVCVERRCGAKMRDPYRSWILELDAIDPGGTSFRYDEGDPPLGPHLELWIDYRHFRFVMSELFNELDMAILNDHKLWVEQVRV